MTVKLNYTVKGSITLDEDSIMETLDLAEAPTELTEDQKQTLLDYHKDDGWYSISEDTDGLKDKDVTATITVET